MKCEGETLFANIGVGTSLLLFESPDVESSQSAVLSAGDTALIRVGPPPETVEATIVRAAPDVTRGEVWPQDEQTPEALAAKQKAEIARWSPVIKELSRRSVWSNTRSSAITTAEAGLPSTVPWPQKYSAHRAIHRDVGDKVQGLLEGLRKFG